MARLTAFCICLAMILALSACGGGNAPANGGTPAANTTGGGDGGAKANAPDETPKEDPDLYKKLKSAMPDSWHTLKSPVRKELERHLKPIPADWKFVSGIVNSEAPGPTEPDEAWGEWEKQAAGAMLYFVGKEQQPAKAAAAELAKQVAAGEADAQGSDTLAWLEMQGGEVPVYALSNKLGTYLIVGVVLTSETEAAKAAIRKWAESVKPE